jgi:hypothetical protein
MRVILTDQQLRRWRREGRTPEAIMAATGWSEPHYRRRIAQAYGRPAAGDPSPEAIAAACLEIQQEWSHAERQRRLIQSGSAFRWKGKGRGGCPKKSEGSRGDGFAA